MFGQVWFFQTEEERERGVNLRRMMKDGCGIEFDKLSGDMGIPDDVSPPIRVGLLKKPASMECIEESKELAHYVPSLEQFKSHIKHLNPRSAGGPTGLTYLLVQLWPDEVKGKIYEELRINWVEKRTSKLWSMKLLQAIPKKKEDPGAAGSKTTNAP